MYCLEESITAKKLKKTVLPKFRRMFICMHGEHLYSAFQHIRAQSAFTLITLKDQESNPYLTILTISFSVWFQVPKLAWVNGERSC